MSGMARVATGSAGVPAGSGLLASGMSVSDWLDPYPRRINLPDRRFYRRGRIVGTYIATAFWRLF